MGGIWNVFCLRRQADENSPCSFCTNYSLCLLQEIDGYTCVFSCWKCFNILHPSKKEHEMVLFYKVTFIKITLFRHFVPLNEFVKWNKCQLNSWLRVSLFFLICAVAGCEILTLWIDYVPVLLQLLVLLSLFCSLFYQYFCDIVL